MREVLLATMALAAAQPLAARAISKITYEGVGTIGYSWIDPWPSAFDDPRRTLFPMPLGTKISITGSITFEQPYIDEDATGTFDLFTQLEDYPRSNWLVSDFHVYAGPDTCLFYPLEGIRVPNCGHVDWEDEMFFHIGLSHGHLSDIKIGWGAPEEHENMQYLTANSFDMKAAPSDPGLVPPTYGQFVVARFGGSWSLRDSTISITTVAVPEPASWALMIAGFSLVGAAQRRSRGLQRLPQVAV